MNRTCKTCKHWISPEQCDEKEIYPEGDQSYGFCGLEEKIHEVDHKPNDMRMPDEMIYSYYEGGRFSTGPDFGCVHHDGLPCRFDTDGDGNCFKCWRTGAGMCNTEFYEPIDRDS